MKIESKTILITGANRGIGQALVGEALRLGARRIYAGTRSPMTHPDSRVTPLQLDVTDEAQIRQAVSTVGELDILINNAGVAYYDDLTDRSMLDRHLAVNFFGMYDLVQAFLPALTRSRGAIVNNLSMVAFASFPPNRLLFDL
jgi:NAD(P)-dependent dehydrogenase (short-subunit alcohol dehydrogenase family)